MADRTASRWLWGLVGVPIAFSLSSYITAALLARFEHYDKVLLVVWIAALVFLIASGLKAIMKAVPAARITRWLLGAVYAAGMYVLSVAIGFISMCAFGGCGS
jgi:hypothetical protein